MEKMNRRDLMIKAGLASLGAAAATSAVAAQNCSVTPPQMVGPYYPESGQVWEDADLTVFRGSTTVAQGEPIIVHGVVTDAKCLPLPNALVEIWQADKNGKYKHSADDRNVPLDQNFQYWGRIYTDAQGRYAFKTVFPGKYPGRTPHIHFRVVAASQKQSLVTQLYFSELASNNRQDSIYADLVNRRLADRVTTTLSKDQNQGVRVGQFNISLATTGMNGTPVVD